MQKIMNYMKQKLTIEKRVHFNETQLPGWVMSAP
jgi:hypothetical protein